MAITITPAFRESLIRESNRYLAQQLRKASTPADLADTLQFVPDDPSSLALANVRHALSVLQFATERLQASVEALAVELET